jgi:hypothetical protein
MLLEIYEAAENEQTSNSSFTFSPSRHIIHMIGFEFLILAVCFVFKEVGRILTILIG